MKVSLEEVSEFLKEISPYNAPKITRKELKTYLNSFPKTYSNKEIAFLMNGLYEMDSGELHELLSSTPIEAFDPVEEAFNLLDVEGKGHLTVETFKEIFKNLNFGEITPSDEDIFKEVADFDKDGVINIEDFRKILSNPPAVEVIEENQEAIEGMDEEEDNEAQAV